MKPRQLLQVALGILAAIGGFVDIGELVFNGQAGGTFGYSLIWAVLLGLIGILVYAEMCGRVAAVSQRAVFDLIRERMGFLMGLVTLVAAELVCLLTLTAETGGVALVLRMLTGLPYGVLLVVAVAALLLMTWFLPFEWLERIFGYVGLSLLVFAVAAVLLHPDWGSVARGALPSLDAGKPALYLYFAIVLIATTVSPYEVYFYSSGGVEDRWTKEDLKLNRLTVFLGFGLGALLSTSLLVVSAKVLLPASVSPQHMGSTALTAAVALGPIGLILGLLGMLFAVGGAALETSLAGAYSLAQFLGWPWGKFRHPVHAPRFTIAWIVMFVIAGLILATGVDPVRVTEYAVIFAAVAMPFTYLPVLLAANDKSYMGGQKNGWLANSLGWAFLGVITLSAVLAIPLLVITNGGQG
jgi:Mn2+/Fe2+ NRAMP family transporter